MRRWILVAAAALGVVVMAVTTIAGIGLGSAFARAEGEPPEVVVATWMRDNGLGWTVSRLENVYYATVARAEVGGKPAISADLAIEDGDGAEAVGASGHSASDTNGSSPGSAVANPSPSPSTHVPDHLEPPSPIVSPVANPEPKEGIWQPVGSRIDGVPAMYATRVRADDVHTSYYASVLWIDTKLAKAMFVPGYEEPRGGPNPYDGALPEEYWPQVLANVNGGFRLNDAQGGYAYDGEVVRPMVDGIATAVVYRNGDMKIGKWGRDFPKVTDDMMAVRQNLALIVDKGKSKVSNANDSYQWGATTDGESLAWRSAIGERADGSIVYIGSPYLSAAGMADTMVRAGVQRAMVLDMNNWWTAGFYFRHGKDGTPKCRKLDPAIAEGCDRFLNRYKRDSFHFLARQDIG